jgi:hypothetical protein
VHDCRQQEFLTEKGQTRGNAGPLLNKWSAESPQWTEVEILESGERLAGMAVARCAGSNAISHRFASLAAVQSLIDGNSDLGFEALRKRQPRLLAHDQALHNYAKVKAIS